MIIMRNLFPGRKGFWNRGLWRRRYLFVLGHMRSGSTLLVHLLATNPNVAVVGESHIRYSRKGDLKRLSSWLERELGERAGNAQLHVDKILHGKYLAPGLLARLNVNLIYIVREPVASIASMMSRFGPKWGWTMQDACRYYVRQLETLASYVRAHGGTAVAVDYDDLVDRTEKSLVLLQRVTGVTGGFKAEYEVLPVVGRDKVGDSSSKIRRGRVVREKREPGICIPDQARRELLGSYRSLWELLSKSCLTLDASPRRSVTA